MVRLVTRPDGDVAELDRNRLVMQPTLDGHGMTGWFDLEIEGGATLAEATDAADQGCLAVGK